MTTQELSTSKTDQLLSINENTKRAIFIICVVICLTPFISPAIALLLGLAIAQLTGHPYLSLNHKATHLLLQISVVGLGFGMNVHSALQAGREGILFTIVSITTTLTFGYFMGKWLNIEQKTSYLISAGTAICGGSAIAAISPVIKAEEKQISVALGCVFILNSIALFIFPLIGHYFNLSQTQFGLWCAIAIRMEVLLYPAVGANFNTGSYLAYGNDRFLTRDFMKFGYDVYAPDLAQRKDRYVVPMAATVAQVTGLPRTLIQTADNDPLRDEGEAYGRKLREAGVDCTNTRYMGLTHDFQVLNAINKVPAVQASIRQVVLEMKDALK